MSRFKLLFTRDNLGLILLGLLIVLALVSVLLVILSGK